MRLRGLLVLGATLAVLVASSSAAPSSSPGSSAVEDPWRATGDGEARVVLYFFWSPHCPHCLEATARYYLYLALYVTVYVVPLLLIVALFVVSLGRRKLLEREGRLLKLLSGT